MSGSKWDVVGFGAASGIISVGAAVALVDGKALTAAFAFLMSVIAWTCLVDAVWKPEDRL